MKFKVSAIVLCCLFAFKLSAQDINCKVQVLTPAIQSSDKQRYTEMEKAIFEFVNNTKWTSDIIQINERIEMNIVINIKEQLGQDDYKATAQILCNRPVFNTSYNSTLFNFIDEEWTFRYIMNQPLEYNDNETRSNLTSLLAYYINISIGLDYDSFSKLGGTPYYQKARNIVNLCQGQSGRGWKTFDGTRNRFILVDNLLDNSYKKLRETYYTYHRLGLDVFSQNIDNGRAEIADYIPILQKVAKDKPNSMLLNVFFTAKADELVNIFSKAIPSEKAKIAQTLSEIDPTNNSKYQQILKSN